MLFLQHGQLWLDFFFRDHIIRLTALIDLMDTRLRSVFSQLYRIIFYLWLRFRLGSQRNSGSRIPIWLKSNPFFRLFFKVIWLNLRRWRLCNNLSFLCRCYFLVNLTHLIVARIIFNFLLVKDLNFRCLFLHNLLQSVINSTIQLIIQMYMVPPHFLVNHLLRRHLEWILLLQVRVPFNQFFVLFSLDH